MKDGYIGVSQGPSMLGGGPASYKVVGKCGMAWEGVGAGDRVNGKRRGTATSLQMTLSLASHRVGGPWVIRQIPGPGSRPSPSISGSGTGQSGI